VVANPPLGYNYVAMERLGQILGTAFRVALFMAGLLVAVVIGLMKGWGAFFGAVGLVIIVAYMVSESRSVERADREREESEFAALTEDQFLDRVARDAVFAKADPKVQLAVYREKRERGLRRGQQIRAEWRRREAEREEEERKIAEARESLRR
jgi:hypothetical protein